MPQNTRCRACGHVCVEPSFSEGPKVWNDDQQTEVRFAASLYLCPACLSTDLEPTNAAPREVLIDTTGAHDHGNN